MPLVTPYYDFVLANGPLSRAEFLQRIQSPHLFFENHLELGDEDTAVFRVTRRPRANEATPVVLLKRHGLSEELGFAGISPIKKSRSNPSNARITFGRGLTCDIVVTDRQVSSSHAHFQQVEGHWTITDDGSTNGTTVDDVPLSPDQATALTSGTRIELAGAVSATFLEPAELYTLITDLAKTP